MTILGTLRLGTQAQRCALILRAWPWVRRHLGHHIILLAPGEAVYILPSDIEFLAKGGTA